MPKKDVTAGEELCTFLRRQVIDRDIWPQVATALSGTGRGEEWAAFAELAAATQLTGRLVAAGAATAESLGGKDSLDSDEYGQWQGNVLNDLSAGVGKGDQRERAAHLTTKAVRASWGRVTEAAEKVILREAGKGTQVLSVSATPHSGVR